MWVKDREEQWVSKKHLSLQKRTTGFFQSFCFLYYYYFLSPTLSKEVIQFGVISPLQLTVFTQRKKVHSSLAITLNTLFISVRQIFRLKRGWPASYWLQQWEMKSNIQYPPTVIQGRHVDSRLFWEQHEWTFIIHVIKSTSCMYAFYAHTFFMFLAVQHVLDFVMIFIFI